VLAHAQYPAGYPVQHEVSNPLRGATEDHRGVRSSPRICRRLPGLTTRPVPF